MPLAKHSNAAAPVLNHFSLEGKICVVTGGARGIGEQIVRGFAEAGADVALIFRTTAGADVAAKIAEETGRRVEAFQGDVTKRDEIAACMESIKSGFGRGRIDVVVANAGVCANIPNLEYTEEQWTHNNSVNIDGVMWTAQAAGKIFRTQGSGNFIITASVSATLVNIPQRQAAYNASKAAAKHLGKSLAVEWVDFARVNVVSPGFIGTPSKWTALYCSPCLQPDRASLYKGTKLMISLQCYGCSHKRFKTHGWRLCPAAVLPNPLSSRA
jgi:sorbose reductase